MKAQHTLLNPYSSLPASGSLSVSALDPPVQQHLKSLRIQSGEEISFMDGRGLFIQCRCEETRPLVFSILSHTHSPRPHPEIELCVAAPRGELLWETLSGATELGVNSIRLLKSDHSQIPKGWDLPLARMQKVSDAAASQCRQSWRVDFSKDWSDLEEALGSDPQSFKVFADEKLSEKRIYGFAPGAKIPPAFSKIQLFVGPEGGWSESERKSLQNAALGMGLGPLILRVPTASVAALYFLRSTL